MGGGYYNRDVAPTGSAKFSTEADRVFRSSYSLHPTCNPRQRTLECHTEDAIVVAIDVTGSMGEFPRIIFDKLPMFFGQIAMQGYLGNTSISFAAIGDVDSDLAPLQITDFVQGGPVTDEHLSRIWVEGGGGDAPESYEYAAYFYASKVNFRCLREKAIMFITGDEVFKSVDANKLLQHFGDVLPRLPSNEEIFHVLRQRYHVFFLCRTQSNGVVPPHVMQAWSAVIGEDHVLPLVNPKAVIDVMLGCIAMVSKQRNLQTYAQDMKSRGQTDDRVDEVLFALQRVRLTA